MEAWREELYLKHSAKGTTWDEHLYVKKVGKNYRYSSDYWALVNKKRRGNSRVVKRNATKRSRNKAGYQNGPGSEDSFGTYGKGNIDLLNRPQYVNEDGSISTVRSISFGTDEGEILIPTVGVDKNGKAVLWSDDEAIDHYYKTGQYLGKFKTPEEATEYAEKLHKQQEEYYGRKRKIQHDLFSDTGFMIHSAKGTSWKDHKYISKENGVYKYPKDALGAAKKLTSDHVTPGKTVDLTNAPKDKYGAYTTLPEKVKEHENKRAEQTKQSNLIFKGLEFVTWFLEMRRTDPISMYMRYKKAQE